MAFKVLVTGACGSAGSSMIQALQQEPVSVLACDAERVASTAAETPAVERFAVHRCGDPEFIGDLVSLCVRHDVDMLVPTSEQEQAAVAKVQGLFERFGTRVWLAPIPAHVTRSQARRIVLSGERARIKDGLGDWLRRRSGLRARA